MNILIASSISKSAIEQLNKNHDIVCAFDAPEDKLVSFVGDRDIIIFRSGVKISAKVMEAAPNLKYLLNAGSRLDNLDIEYSTKRGLQIIQIQEPGARAIAEFSFLLMLALSRNLVHSDRELKKGCWTNDKFSGYLLRGKVLGVIGAGSIGSLVGQMGSFWGMTVLGYVDENEYTPAIRANLTSKGIRLTTFDEVVCHADYLTIYVPLKASTKNLIDKIVMKKMKVGSYLINLTKDGVVNEKDLHDELTKGDRLRGAAFDIQESGREGKISSLASLPNVILTPNLGAQTVDSRREIGEKIVEIVDSLEYRFNVSKAAS